MLNCKICKFNCFARRSEISHKNNFDVKICAKYIFVPYTLQKTWNFGTESHSVIHKIADKPSTFPYTLVSFLTDVTFFSISIVDTVGVHKFYE